VLHSCSHLLLHDRVRAYPSNMPTVIFPGCRVSSCRGEFIQDEARKAECEANGKRFRLRRECLFGTVIASASEAKWQVRWDANGRCESVPQNCLKFVDPGSALPRGLALEVTALSSRPPLQEIQLPTPTVARSNRL
jgi:hypothetical protein